jgi:hypothetical protein
MSLPFKYACAIKPPYCYLSLFIVMFCVLLFLNINASCVNGADLPNRQASKQESKSSPNSSKHN